MLGQLLNRRANPTPRPATTLESQTEENHTRNLLFPDLSQLHQPEGHAYPLSGSGNTASGYDGPLAEIDLEQARDIRVIVAQDDAIPTERAVLFDTKPAVGVFAPDDQAKGPKGRHSRQGSAASATPSIASHSRRGSLVSASNAPRSPPPSGGAFFSRGHGRSASLSGVLPNIDEGASARQKESEELVRTCLDCMFGNTAMSYRGPSNKLHIIPLETKPHDTLTTPIITDGFSSFGKAEGRRRSNLAKSYTPTNPPPDIPQTIAESEENPAKERRRTIMITRTFSVSRPDEYDNAEPATLQATNSTTSFSGNMNGSSFHNTPHRRSKARRSPMYGITIILHLPVASSIGSFGPSRPSLSKSTSKTGSSIHGTSLGSSVDSDRRAGFTLTDANFGTDSIISTGSFSSDVDDRVDVITQHWDVITRTLTSLQFVVQDRILKHFAKPNTPRRAVKLPPQALAFDEDIKRAMDAATERVIKGMRIPRVITGQGRWGVWRDEARVIGRWAGNREQNFFFFNLLTAFLGSHTEWLSILGPKPYRKRHHEQQKTTSAEDLTITSRTVIVSSDKIAARRLIFLLSAFLPASHSAPGASSPLRPSTSASFRAYSPSPPPSGSHPISRQQSLRRTINMRRKNDPHLAGSYGSARDLSPSKPASIDERTEIATSVSHSRRPSEARSVMSELTMPSSQESAARKSSTATTLTITPQHASGAHFTAARQHRPAATRPDSSGSVASTNLRHTLHQTHNAGIDGSMSTTDSQPNSRWGSLISMWSGRRGSSTDDSSIHQTTDDGMVSASTSRPNSQNPHQGSTNKLEQMIRELQMPQTIDTRDREELYAQDLEDYDSTDQLAQASPDSQSTPPQRDGSADALHPRGRAIPQKGHQSLDSNISISVAEGGIVDVSIPMLGSPPLTSPIWSNSALDSDPNLLTLQNFGFGGPSSSFSGSASTLAMLRHPSCDHDARVNVAGWLARFHADFALQAVAPYANLEQQIRAAMSAEPTPSVATTPVPDGQGQGQPQLPMEKWVDVCSTLIADARTFSLKRLKLRRRIRLIPAPAQPALTPAPSRYGGPQIREIPAPVTEVHLEEYFEETRVMDLDATLVDAVETIIASTSGATSASSSAVPSRSGSRKGRGRRERRSGSDLAATAAIPPAASGPAKEYDRAVEGDRKEEIPRQDCRKIVLGALEKVAKGVAEERSVTSERNGSDTRDEQTNGSGATGDVKRGRRKSVRRLGESSLTEGVRTWLSSVETAKSSTDPVRAF